MTANIYHSPETFGLETIGEVDFSTGSYEFDLLAVWQRKADGAFLYGEDAGCSCPSPFDTRGVDELHPVESLAQLKALLEERNCKAFWSDPDRPDEIARLLERLHDRGLR